MKRLICFLVLVTGTVRSTAQWSNDPTVNNAICTAAWDQVSPSIVSDGAGGAIITWEDRTQIGNRNIYAQRINSSGVVQWATNGVAICVATADQRFPTIVSDDAGGAIIAWHDVRSATSYDIYAQRVNSSGVVQWTTNGVAISMATQNQLYPTVVGDGAGGAIITWYDFRGGTDYDIYTQRINSSGVIQWTTNGVVICAANGNQESPTIVSDGAGGAIVTWWDPRNATTNNDIYAQRINSSGVVQWTADGIAICATVGDQRFPTLVSDDAGGAIITWHDIRSGVSYDIYAQRINASGAIQWTTNGVAICTAVSDQGYPTIVSNGAGGALITWHDFRGGITTDPNIYAQRIDSSGVVQWTANGVAISTAPRYQIYPTLVSDGGGAIITWDDTRSGNNNDIYAQRVRSDGLLGATPTVPSQVITTFPANGAASQPVNVTLQWRTASGAAFYRVQLATDSTFTNLVVNDSSLTDTARAVGPLTNNTLYYWRVNARNAVGDGPYSTRSSFTTIVPLPSQVNLVSPVNGATNQPVNLTLRWRATPGVAFYRVQLATDSAFTNLILNDSSLTDTARTVGPLSNNTLYYWRVNARNAAGDGPFSTVSSFTTIVSLPSQVNLVSPVNGATIGADSVRCLWGSSSPSVTNYWFERSADSMFTNTLIDSTLTDTSKVTRGLLPNTSYWWRVRARNVAGWGVYSIARRFVTLFTDVGESLTELLENALMQNYPNPFNPTTTISFSIPSKSFVSLKVFDALGREVSSLLSEELSAGKYSQQWNAEGLASGVYLYRLQAGSFTETKKLMLLR